MTTMQQLSAAKAWADEALASLHAMTLDERYLWLATKPRGEMHFNSRRVRYVIENFPQLRSAFDALGVIP